MNVELSSNLPAKREVPRFDLDVYAQKRSRYCLVVPVINEGNRIRQLLSRIHALAIDRSIDVIIADGGSTDGSLDPTAMRELGVRVVVTKRDAGKLSAQLRCAYAYCLDQGYEGIVTIDGNNKDDPEPIPRFVEALDAGYDFVQASRFVPGGVEENTPPSRRLAIRWIHAPILSISSGFRWTDTTQGFRAYSAKMLLDPRVQPFRQVFQSYELLAYLSYRAPKLGYRCIELPTARRYPAGEPVPTKINGMRGNFDLVKVLLTTATGGFNPPRP